MSEMRVFDAKQPGEEYYVEFDFTNVMDTDTVASATATAIDQAGADATDVIITAAYQALSAAKVYVWVKGGVTGSTYTITVKATSSSSPAEKYELEAQLPVVEIVS